jgi:hypothetical protein
LKNFVFWDRLDLFVPILICIKRTWYIHAQSSLDLGVQCIISWDGQRPFPRKQEKTPFITITTTTAQQYPRLFLNDVALLAHVQTVQELSNILVAYSANLLDIGGGL